jgi:hypothetical protein
MANVLLLDCKSLAIDALTAGCACIIVAEYTFTALKPVVGAVDVVEDGSVIDEEDAGRHDDEGNDTAYSETIVEKGGKDTELMTRKSRPAKV